MVSVVALQPFLYRGQSFLRGDAVEMEAIDAAVQAQAGVVSLLHGQTYQTRHMVAAEPDPQPVVVAAPPTRRRRARKTQA